MMFNEKMIACVKANGKILREFKDTVYLPYGSEYQIYLKNLNSVRALVHIQIDGKEMMGGGLVLNANSEATIERSVVNGNLKEGNRFKFIERTSSIEKHRGVGAEDGILRISFQFEKPFVSILDDDWKYKKPASPWYPKDPYYPSSTPTFGPLWNTTCVGNSTPASSGDSSVPTKGILRSAARGSSISGEMFGATSASTQNFCDVGITVPGSISDQKFSTTTIGALESTVHVIVLRLLGEDPNAKQVKEPITVKAKPKCVTCGRVNKATAKFCTNCGTALTII